MEGQKTYKWWGHHVGDYALPAGFSARDLGKCDHALKVRGNNNAYEVGVCFKDGKYELLWDFYAGGQGLMEVVGTNCQNLVNSYTTIVAKQEATKFANANNYYMTEEFDNKTQETVLKLRRY